MDRRSRQARCCFAARSARSAASGRRAGSIWSWKIRCSGAPCGTPTPLTSCPWSVDHGMQLKPSRRSVLSRHKATKTERSSAPRRGDAASPKPALPLTVSRPELLNEGTDRDFRRLVHNNFAFMARHEAIRDGHARQIGLAGVEYTILISIGHLGLDCDVNVKTVADHLHMSGAFITTVTSKL